ncbi:PspA/IM30 family protein [Phaeobacter sp. HF9A]|uniref:PspA/IM30 family protein n=1 Tax=Phaeobacter sp. HF9A TaxID=2721561 RepID=UPI0020CA8987|nr:PspA/IM30 family protein [Phaeobacter sp. HF9A]
MFSTFKTLMTGANRRAETQLRQAYSIELIEEKIAQAADDLKAAKSTLVSLIQKERAEARQIAALDAGIADLTSRARAALSEGREDLAGGAVGAIAEMENERRLRQDTKARLEARILRLRQSVEAGHRRLIDLRQGAISARAVKGEQRAQVRLGRSVARQPMDEAAELIAEVLGQEDPFEASEILGEIETGLTPQSVADQLAEAGFGAASKSTAADVLSRLKSED